MYICIYIRYNVFNEVSTLKNTAKIFKNGNGQAISLTKSVMERAGLNIGDELVISIEDGMLKYEKEENQSFEDKWNSFFKNGGSYNEHELIEFDEVGREHW